MPEWAHRMQAWFSLTTVDYRGAGWAEAAPHHGSAVQLAAQEAKAWARLGDRRQVEVALDKGRDTRRHPAHCSNSLCARSLSPVSVSVSFMALRQCP